MAKATTRLTTADIIKNDSKGLLADWMAELRSAGEDPRISQADLRAQAEEFLQHMAGAAVSNVDVSSQQWQPVRTFLEGVSRSRAKQGFTSQETATFIAWKEVCAHYRRYGEMPVNVWE